jgi:hypothetical protein
VRDVQGGKLMSSNAESSYISRQKAETALLYTTAAIWLLRPSNPLKITHAALFALGATYYLRPHPNSASRTFLMQSMQSAT